MERAKGIESDFTSFSGWTPDADLEMHSSQIALQPCQYKYVATIPSVGTVTADSVSMSDQTAPENRTLTEQRQNTDELDGAFGSLLPQLLAVWPKIPESVKTGIIAMLQAAVMTTQGE